MDKTKDKKEEFIVAYNTTSCQIDAAWVDKFYPDEYGPKKMYEHAIFCHLNLYKYGDIVPYNNQLWCSVQAENAKEAFDIFIEKFDKEIKNNAT